MFRVYVNLIKNHRNQKTEGTNLLLIDNSCRSFGQVTACHQQAFRRVGHTMSQQDMLSPPISTCWEPKSVYAP